MVSHHTSLHPGPPRIPVGSHHTSLHPQTSQDPSGSYHTVLHPRTSWGPSGVPSHFLTSPDLPGSKWGPIKDHDIPGDPITHCYNTGPPRLPWGSIKHHYIPGPPESQWDPITHHNIPRPPRIPVGFHHTLIHPWTSWAPSGLPSHIITSPDLPGSQ